MRKNKRQGDKRMTTLIPYQNYFIFFQLWRSKGIMDRGVTSSISLSVATLMRQEILHDPH